MFRRNVGGFDRGLRLALGVLLTPAGLFLLGRSPGWGWTFLVVGLIGLTTGLAGFCPNYVLFGISTARPRGGTSSIAGSRRGPHPNREASL